MMESLAAQAKMVRVTAENIADHPQAICFINPNHELYHKKVDWLQEQFRNGLTIQLLYLPGEKRAVGFVEYTPGECCWRAVSAKGYMFIHCLWTNGKKYQHRGLGARLLEEVEKDAAGKTGVAVVTSDSSFMAGKDIFLHAGYQIAESAGKEQLLVKQFKEGDAPVINNWQKERDKYQGLAIVYSRQCPWVARFIEEIKPVLKEAKLSPSIVELTTPAEAQRAPSLYAVFNLIYNGRVLADRYISVTRFKNILKSALTN